MGRNLWRISSSSHPTRSKSTRRISRSAWVFAKVAAHALGAVPVSTRPAHGDRRSLNYAESKSGQSARFAFVPRARFAEPARCLHVRLQNALFHGFSSGSTSLPSSVPHVADLSWSGMWRADPRHGIRFPVFLRAIPERVHPAQWLKSKRQSGQGAVRAVQADSRRTAAGQSGSGCENGNPRAD